MVMGDQIKERQKIQRFNLTNGGAVEVNGAESGNVYIEAFDEDNPLCGTVLEPTPAECDAIIAAIGRALGRPAPALPVTVTAECDGNTFSIRVRGMAEPAAPSTPLEERIATAADKAQREAEARENLDPRGMYCDGTAHGLRAALAMVREQGATVPRAGVEAVVVEIDALTCEDSRAIVEIRRSLVELLAAPTTPPEKG